MSWWQQPLTTLAFVWRIERSDGVALGFTSHDRDLDRDGLRHSSAPGMLPSAARLTDGLDADDMELAGALTSAALTATDLASGRWDGARLTLAAVDWADPDAAPVPIVRGGFGSVALKDGAFEVALRGATAALDIGVAEEISPSCRATLGDRRCRVDLNGRRRRATVIAAVRSTMTLAEVPAADGAFEYGTLRWLGGDNAGLSARIVASAGATLTLAEAPPLPLVPPVAVEIVEGCDRQFATCGARFANAANFRGEPHLPGNDLLTRYGG